jgi:hypothetical protein
MKQLGEEAIAALARGDAVVGGAIAIMCDPPVRVFSGWGELLINGAPFEGIGDRALGQVSSGAIGGAAQNLTISLSGIDPAVLELIDADEVRHAPAGVWRLIWAADAKSLLGAYVFKRCRVDQLVSEEEVGGEAVLRTMLETSARGLGLRGGRMRSDADQRLVKANDGFFRNLSYAGEKMLYLGGRRRAWGRVGRVQRRWRGLGARLRPRNDSLPLTIGDHEAQSRGAARLSGKPGRDAICAWALPQRLRVVRRGGGARADGPPSGRPPQMV